MADPAAQPIRPGVSTASTGRPPVDTALDAAWALFREGRLDDARDAVEELARGTTPPKGLAALIGRVALAQGRAEAAEESLNRAVETAPRDGELWTVLGAARLEIGDLEGAREAFERVLALPADPGVALAGLAEVHQRRGRPEAAIGALREALAGALTSAKGTPLSEGSVLPPSLAEAVATLADRRRRVGRVGEAERLHRIALAGHGACGPALVGLGALRAAGGRQEEAEDLYRAALEQGASPVDAALALARLKEGEGRAGVAAILREAAALAARDGAAILKVAQALAEAGQHASAATQFTRVTRAEPSNGAARRGLVLALVAEGETEDALVHLDRATALTPEEAWPWRMRGDILAGSGRPVRAIAAYRECLTRTPGDGAVLKALSAAQMEVNATDEALASCLAALAAAPVDGELKDRLSDLLSDRGYLDMARTAKSGAGPMDRSRKLPDTLTSVLERSPLFAGLPWPRATCAQLDGGALGLGSLWRVRLGGADLRLRQPLEETGDHGDEGRNMRMAAGLGVAPPVLAFDDADGAHVTLCPPGAPLTAEALRDRAVLGRLTRTLSLLHEGRVVFRGRLDMGAVLARREAALAEQGNLGAVRGHDRLRAELSRVIRALAARAPRDVPLVNAQGLHGYIDGTRQLLITDWSTSAMGDPYRDLGMLANAGRMSEVAERVFLSLYLKQRATPRAVARLRLHRFLDHYLCLLEALDASAAMTDPHPLLDLAESAAKGCRRLLEVESWKDTLSLAAEGLG